jgi:hypothetical protein
MGRRLSGVAGRRETPHGIPDEADALYDERPDAFVAARNALVKALRKEGRRDDATAVAALRRPSAASSSLNQVARHDGELVREVLDTGAALQAATARAVSGKRGDLRSARDANRSAVRALLDAVLARARELGVGNLDQVRLHATLTVQAAIADEDVAALLRAGRLDEDQDPPGFGFGLGVAATPAAEADAADVDEADVDEADADEAEADEAEADTDDGAEDDAARRADEAAEAERAAQRAALEKRIARLQRDADRLGTAAERAERAAQEARARADDAQQSLADAQAELDELN